MLHRREKACCSSPSARKIGLTRLASSTWYVIAPDKKTSWLIADGNLIEQADISDVSKVDFNDFSFKVHGHKHTLQAQSRAERDLWIAAIEARATEAKGSREGITSSTSYKSSLEKFGKSDHGTYMGKYLPRP